MYSYCRLFLPILSSTTLCLLPVFVELLIMVHTFRQHFLEGTHDVSLVVKSHRNSCMKNDKTQSLREAFKSCIFLSSTQIKSFCEVGVIADPRKFQKLSERCERSGFQTLFDVLRSTSFEAYSHLHTVIGQVCEGVKGQVFHVSATP